MCLQIKFAQKPTFKNASTGIVSDHKTNRKSIWWSGEIHRNTSCVIHHKVLVQRFGQWTDTLFTIILDWSFDWKYRRNASIWHVTLFDVNFWASGIKGDKCHWSGTNTIRRTARDKWFLSKFLVEKFSSDDWIELCAAESKNPKSWTKYFLTGFESIWTCHKIDQTEYVIVSEAANRYHWKSFSVDPVRQHFPYSFSNILPSCHLMVINILVIGKRWRLHLPKILWNRSHHPQASIYPSN